VNKTKEKQSQQSIISKKQKVKAWRWTRCKHFRVVIINPTDLQHRTFREAVSLLKNLVQDDGGKAEKRNAGFSRRTATLLFLLLSAKKAYFLCNASASKIANSQETAETNSNCT